jgi:hypothetical protein
MANTKCFCEGNQQIYFINLNLYIYIANIEKHYNYVYIHIEEIIDFKKS